MFAIGAVVLLVLAMVLGYGFIKRKDKGDAPKVDATQGQTPPTVPPQAPPQVPAQVPTTSKPPATRQPTPEQRRDADLKAAKDCERAADWPCVISMTRRVLEVDADNQEAKALQARVTRIQLGIDKAPEAAKAEAPPAPADCGAIVRTGRAALKARRYDEAVATANSALSALALCPEAEQLKQDAMRARQKSER